MQQFIVHVLIEKIDDIFQEKNVCIYNTQNKFHETFVRNISIQITQKNILNFQHKNNVTQHINN